MAKGVRNGGPNPTGRCTKIRVFPRNRRITHLSLTRWDIIRTCTLRATNTLVRSSVNIHQPNKRTGTSPPEMAIHSTHIPAATTWYVSAHSQLPEISIGCDLFSMPNFTSEGHIEKVMILGYDGI
jgi:hypothetical protein